jgi:tRNA1Val (adenine37-N6)-methyltransferase
MLLYQPEKGYCYNSDSIFLYDFINALKPRGRMLDVGAGCGVVGLLTARDNPRVQLEAVEKQDAFVRYASKNAEVNGIGYTVHHTDFLDFHDEKGFDYIVSNPPFYHEGASRSQDEMIHTARYNIHLPIDAFIAHAARLLRPQGHLAFCYDPQQFAHLCAACERAKLRVVDVQFVHSKPGRNATLVLLHARKNSRSLMQVRPPLFAFDGDEFSAKSRQIYRDARTHSIKCSL